LLPKAGATFKEHLLLKLPRDRMIYRRGCF
jgi:hypothetical protein